MKGVISIHVKSKDCFDMGFFNVYDRGMKTSIYPTSNLLSQVIWKSSSAGESESSIIEESITVEEYSTIKESSTVEEYSIKESSTVEECSIVEESSLLNAYLLLWPAVDLSCPPQTLSSRQEPGAKHQHCPSS